MRDTECGAELANWNEGHRAIKREKHWDKEDTWNFVDEEVEWDEGRKRKGMN